MIASEIVPNYQLHMVQSASSYLRVSRSALSLKSSPSQHKSEVDSNVEKYERRKWDQAKSNGLTYVHIVFDVNFTVTENQIEKKYYVKVPRWCINILTAGTSI